MEFAQQLLRIIAIVTELALLGVATMRGAARRVPMFLVYLYWGTLGDLAAYVYGQSGLPGYTVLCDVHVAIETVVLILVLFDLARRALRPFSKPLRRGALGVLGLVTVATGTVIWVQTASSWPLFKRFESFHLYLREDLTSSLLLVLILLLIGGMVEFLGKHYLPVGWGKPEIQIATGMGIYALASLAEALANTYQALMTPFTFLAIAIAVAVIYEGCLIYWLVCFMRPEPGAGEEVAGTEGAESDSTRYDLWQREGAVAASAFRPGMEGELKERECV